jgi:nitric oxide synthase oxygenase domain/subunit
VKTFHRKRKMKIFLKGRKMKEIHLAQAPIFDAGVPAARLVKVEKVGRCTTYFYAKSRELCRTHGTKLAWRKRLRRYGRNWARSMAKVAAKIRLEDAK